MRRIVLGAMAVVVVSFLAIQLVPYGRVHSNPAIRAEPSWNSPQTRDLAARVCFDCHSNATEWPWYSDVAPVSWVIQRDVDKGRSRLNFSEWDRPQRDARDASKAVRQGEMPPWYYLLPRQQVRLSPAENAIFVQGLEATLGTERRQGGDARP